VTTTSPSPGVPPDGFRLPGATHVGAVRLQVTDLGRSLAYYERTLGLAVLEREGGAARLGPHGGGAVLVELHEMAAELRSRARPVRPMTRLGLYHFAILLPGLAHLGRFLAHLAALGLRPGAADHLVSEALYLHDPDGLGIEVYADRPRESWQVGRGGELAMATDPLDLGSLIRAGGGEAWAGMPAGTAMGHVHLHVGDLGRAHALYHDALGLDLMVWSYPGALFLAAGGYHHHLGLNVWAGDVPPPGEEEARLLEWELVLPDARSVAAAAASVEKAGHPVEADGADRRLADPWGTRLRLVAGA
jgi:catechol 2,3-dioxygenase